MFLKKGEQEQVFSSSVIRSGGSHFGKKLGECLFYGLFFIYANCHLSFFTSVRLFDLECWDQGCEDTRDIEIR